MKLEKKREILGQYFTKPESVSKILDLFFEYKKYDKSISILEPSSGTGNFVKQLQKKGYKNILDCEIDDDLTKTPMDYFDFSIDNKFDLVIGNPPFTKYNLKDSYYYVSKYNNHSVRPNLYIEKIDIKQNKLKIENAFIYKSIKHLKSDDSSIGFVLPISFFIKNKNKTIKDIIKNTFSTIIIYQNEEVWFDRDIPCCFVIFTNIAKFNNEIVIIHENSHRHEIILDISEINEELIPQVVFNKKNDLIKNNSGILLSRYLSDDVVIVKKSFKENNVSAKNILSKSEIPEGENVADYRLAVVRVGNSSIGKSGLINVKKDILNDMFFVFDFKDEFKSKRKIKEDICREINLRMDYFKRISCRVGSKSIKKSDVYNLKINIVDRSQVA